MGTFGGHALPGSFFIIFAVWWTTQIFHRYFKSLRKNGEPFKLSVTFPFMCLCRRANKCEMEGIFKVVFTTVGFIGEIYTGFIDGEFRIYGNAQHATMFFMFGLSGVIDILMNLGLPIPFGMEYIMPLLAFSVEGILFHFHLHGRSDMDILVHTLLLYVIAACIFAMLAEMRFRRSPLAGLSRAYFVFLQGAWLWQIGFILHNPMPGAKPWNQDDHEQMMIVTMIFAWHMAAVCLVMLAMGLVIGCCHRARYGPWNSVMPYDSLQMHLIKKNSNGHSVVDLNDSESEIELEQPLRANSQ